MNDQRYGRDGKRTHDDGWYSPSLTSPELQWRLDSRWELLSVNRSYQSYSPTDLTRGGYPLLRRLLAGTNPTLLDAAILEAGRRHSTVPVIETSGRDPGSGQEVHFITTLCPRYDLRDNLVAIEGTSRDVTLLRQIESTRNREVAELAAVTYVTSRIGRARTWKELLKLILAGAEDVVGGPLACLEIETGGASMRVAFPSLRAVSRLCSWMAEEARTMLDSQRQTEAVRIYDSAALPNALRKLRLGIALIPLHVDGETVGLMCLTSRSGTQFLVDKRREMLFVAHHVEVSVREGKRSGNLTDARGTQDEVERRRQRVFAAFAEAFSNFKITVLNEEELRAFRHNAERVAVESVPPVPVDGVSSLPLVRRIVETAGRQYNFSEERVLDTAICVTEAATNVLIHGHRGRVHVLRLPDRMQIWVEDSGQGLDISLLARAALLKTYSSNLSMGLGLNIILDMSDHLWVGSSSTGTTIIMEFDALTQAQWKPALQEATG